jgi:gamma-glutamyltranspeptidase/glutathione hydrolase
MGVVVAAGSQIAAEAGARMGADGGNAVDAAIAAIITSLCTEPGVVAPGAGAYLTIWPEGGEPVVLDAYAEMPGRGLPRDAFGQGAIDVAMAYGGGVETIVGPGSVATPGAFAGLALASARYGALPWGVLLEPAIEHVDRGFPLPQPVAEYLVHSADGVFGWDASSRRALFHGNGAPLSTGDTVHLEGLGDSLRQIATEGVTALYRGDLGRRISSAVLAGAGILTMRDLSEYEVLERSPLTTRLDGWTVATNPAPAIGGSTMTALLMLLAGEANGPPETEFRTHAELQRLVVDYRKARIDGAGDGLADELRTLLDFAREADREGIATSASTSHTSASDDAGTSCAITASAGYGSGMIPPGTGFLLNNSLGELELIDRKYHALEPGTRLGSNMAPSVARHRDGRSVAVGSPGADRITTALAQVLHRHLVLDQPIDRAISAPRLHAEWFDGVRTIAYEDALVADLPQNEVGRPFPGRSMFFGGVQATQSDADRILTGAADPRRTGGVAFG